MGVALWGMGVAPWGGRGFLGWAPLGDVAPSGGRGSLRGCGSLGWAWLPLGERGSLEAVLQTWFPPCSTISFESVRVAGMLGLCLLLLSGALCLGALQFIRPWRQSYVSPWVGSVGCLCSFSLRSWGSRSNEHVGLKLGHHLLLRLWALLKTLVVATSPDIVQWRPGDANSILLPGGREVQPPPSPIPAWAAVVVPASPGAPTDTTGGLLAPGAGESPDSLGLLGDYLAGSWGHQLPSDHARPGFITGQRGAKWQLPTGPSLRSPGGGQVAP